MDSSHRHIDIDIQSECVVCEWSYLLDLYHRGHHTSIDIENKSFTEFMFYIDVVVMYVDVNDILTWCTFLSCVQ